MNSKSLQNKLNNVGDKLNKNKTHNTNKLSSKKINSKKLKKKSKKKTKKIYITNNIIGGNKNMIKLKDIFKKKKKYINVNIFEDILFTISFVYKINYNYVFNSDLISNECKKCEACDSKICPECSSRKTSKGHTECVDSDLLMKVKTSTKEHVNQINAKHLLYKLLIAGTYDVSIDDYELTNDNDIANDIIPEDNNIIDLLILCNDDKKILLVYISGGDILYFSKNHFSKFSKIINDYLEQFKKYNIVFVGHSNGGLKCTHIVLDDNYLLRDRTFLLCLNSHSFKSEYNVNQILQEKNYTNYLYLTNYNNHDGNVYSVDHYFIAENGKKPNNFNENVYFYNDNGLIEVSKNIIDNKDDINDNKYNDKLNNMVFRDDSKDKDKKTKHDIKSLIPILKKLILKKKKFF